MKKSISVIICMIILLLTGCGDSHEPVTITVWHYYNGAQKIAFDNLVQEFNNTKGKENNIIVEGHSQGNVTDLEQKVMASINKEVGSEDVPNIFASYADTAYAIEKMGYLADLEPYFTEKEWNEYISSYLEEGKIGEQGQLKIFPTAKATEVFMLNKTDWDLFSNATGITLEGLRTKEGLAETAKAYYEWTDSLTPDIPNDGRAFYGRDAMANLFIIGSKQLGSEIFQVENQTVTLNLDKDIMRKIWNFYYVPYISGYFSSYGRFRSDDVKIGEIIALTGSTASAIYFPDEVTIGEQIYPIENIVLPDPIFKDGQPYAVQQGAGMVVTKGTEREEKAAVTFLQWFTEAERNLKFSYTSGYLPVKKEANKKELFDMVIQEDNYEVNQKIYDTVLTAFDIINDYQLYTNRAFDGGIEARKILEYHLVDKAQADREEVKKLLNDGMSLQEALKFYISDENFDNWYDDFYSQLEKVVQ